MKRMHLGALVLASVPTLLVAQTSPSAPPLRTGQSAPAAQTASANTGQRTQAAQNAQPKDRLTLEDYLEFETVSEPRQSPDGSQIVYTRDESTS